MRFLKAMSTIFVVALIAAIIATWCVPPARTAGADSYIPRQVFRESNDDSPFEWDKTFHGNALLYDFIFNAGDDATPTGECTFALDSAAGAAYDRKLLEFEFGEGEYDDPLVVQSWANGIYLTTGDKITVEYANPETKTVSLQIVTSS